MLVLATSPRVEANEGPRLGGPRAATHLALGPQAAAILADSEWDSELGAELHLAHLRRSRLLSVVGASVGIAGFSKGDILQLSMDFYIGTESAGPFPLGLSVGPLLKAFQHGRPQVGARSTLWLYHGVMPYISVSWLTGPSSPAQPGVEIGVKIPFSIRDW